MTEARHTPGLNTSQVRARGLPSAPTVRTRVGPYPPEMVATVPSVTVAGSTVTVASRVTFGERYVPMGPRSAPLSHVPPAKVAPSFDVLRASPDPEMTMGPAPLVDTSPRLPSVRGHNPAGLSGSDSSTMGERRVENEGPSHADSSVAVRVVSARPRAGKARSLVAIRPVKR